jgi:hypothetical protein
VLTLLNALDLAQCLELESTTFHGTSSETFFGKFVAALAVGVLTDAFVDTGVMEGLVIGVWVFDSVAGLALRVLTLEAFVDTGVMEGLAIGVWVFDCVASVDTREVAVET